MPATCHYLFRLLAHRVEIYDPEGLKKPNSNTYTPAVLPPFKFDSEFLVDLTKNNQPINETNYNASYLPTFIQVAHSLCGNM